MFILGKSFSASSPLTEGWTITSSPVAFVRFCRQKSLRNRKTLTGNPVDRGGDAVLVASLERVDNAQNLGGVTASAGRVREDGADGLLGVDDEDGADGESNALGVNVGGILVVNPSIIVSLSSLDLSPNSVNVHTYMS